MCRKKKRYIIISCNELWKGNKKIKWVRKQCKIVVWLIKYIYNILKIYSSFSSLHISKHNNNNSTFEKTDQTVYIYKVYLFFPFYMCFIQPDNIIYINVFVFPTFMHLSSTIISWKIIWIFRREFVFQIYVHIHIVVKIIIKLNFWCNVLRINGNIFTKN